MLSLLERGLYQLNRILAGFTGALILVMASLVVADVVGRNLAWFSLPWSAEVNEYGLYLTAVLIAPWLLRRGHHVSVDIVMQAMPASVARIVVRITDLFLLGICATLCWYGVAAALRSHGDGSIVIKNVVFPEWWAFVPLSFIFALLALEFLLRLVTGRHPQDPHSALLGG
jgi:TRAP-type C4-dicarboxylate transport system permease small subunit